MATISTPPNPPTVAGAGSLDGTTAAIMTPSHDTTSTTLPAQSTSSSTLAIRPTTSRRTVANIESSGLKPNCEKKLTGEVPQKCPGCSCRSLEPANDDATIPLQITPGGKYSDLTLICKSHEFSVHRLLVCTASSVIAKALDGPYKEAESGVYTVSEFSARAVFFMIHWIYYGDYTIALRDWIESHNKKGSKMHKDFFPVQEELRTHLELNRLADYYDIVGLHRFSLSEIRSMLEFRWNAESMAQVLLEISDLVNDPMVYGIFVNKAASNLKAVVRAISKRTGAYLPQIFMKDVLNKHFEVRRS